MKKKFLTYLPYIAFFIAFTSTLTSLLFSEVFHIPPCTLCWYQRIAMYPLVAIFIVGILRKDKALPIYILPISIGGLLTAAYHNLIYFNVIPEVITTCTNGISCTSHQQTLFGFITIPLLSFFAFAIITVCMILYWRFHSPMLRGIK